MQMKTLATLGAVLAALVLIAWLSGAFESDPSTLDVPDLGVDRASVESIEIVAPAFATTVERTGDRWTLEGSGHPADSLTIRSLLTDFQDLEARAVVTRSPDRYSRYGVDSTATYVRLRTEDDAREFWIGSTAADARTGYIRIHGDERVFTAVPRIMVPTGMSRWRDRRIFRAAPGSVRRVDIETPDGSFAIARTGAEDGAGQDGWVVETDAGRQPADSLAIRRYLNRFDPFRVDGFLESFDESAEETRSLTVTMQDGSTWSLSAGDHDGAMAARVEGVQEAYRLLSSRRSELFPDPESLTAGE